MRHVLRIALALTPSIPLAVGCGSLAGDSQEDAAPPPVDATADAPRAAEDAGRIPGDATFAEDATPAKDAELADAKGAPDAFDAGPPSFFLDDASPPPQCVLDAALPFGDGGCGGSVSFHLDLAPGWVFMGTDTTALPWSNWLTAECSRGGQIDLAPSRGYGTCEGCTPLPPLPTGNGFWSGVASDAGASGAWDGRIFPHGTCGSPVTACESLACAPPGSYVALMCACAPADYSNSTGCARLTCKRIPFDYPANGTVEGTLP